MNCPNCGRALLFGALDCDCGYRGVSAQSSNIELSYWEALRAYWRIYWPWQLFSIAAYQPFVWFPVWGRVYFLGIRNLTQPEQFLLQAGLGAIGLFLFVHRFINSPFRDFSIYPVSDSGAEMLFKLRQRGQVWFFLWWRQLVAALFAALLAAPLNVLLSLIGLRAVLGVDVALWVSALGVILGIGPILLKMLIGHQFPDFRLEVKRFSRKEAAEAAV